MHERVFTKTFCNCDTRTNVLIENKVSKKRKFGRNKNRRAENKQPTGKQLIFHRKYVELLKN